MTDNDLQYPRRINYQQFLFWGIFLLLSLVVIYKSYLIWTKPVQSIDSAEMSQPTSASTTPAMPDIPANLITSKEFGLIIPSIDLAVPVIADVDGTNEKTYLKALEDGVAQFKGTAKPDQKSNVFIFGHSSYYKWRRGNYKTIFARLPELKNGDNIFLWYKERLYYYQISETKVVEPSDVTWLQSTKESYITLSTCYPIDTTDKRLIIRAELKYFTKENNSISI